MEFSPTAGLISRSKTLPSHFHLSPKKTKKKKKKNKKQKKHR